MRDRDINIERLNLLEGLAISQKLILRREPGNQQASDNLRRIHKLIASLSGRVLDQIEKEVCHA